MEVKKLLKNIGLTAVLTGFSIGVFGGSCSYVQYHTTNSYIENKNPPCSCVEEKINSLESENDLVSFLYGTYGVKEAYEKYHKTNCK